MLKQQTGKRMHVCMLYHDLNPFLQQRPKTA